MNEVKTPSEMPTLSRLDLIIDDAINEIDMVVQSHLFHMGNIEQFRCDEETYDAKWLEHHNMYMKTLTEILSDMAIKSQKEVIV